MRNKKETKEGIDIGRPTKWGNPYRVQEYGRKKAVELYEEHLMKSRLIEDIEELRGKVLLCSCAPLECHGEVLIKLLYQ